MRHRAGISGFVIAGAVLVFAAASALAALGSLTLVETKTNGVAGVVMDGPNDVVVSPDGLNVYVTSSTSDGVTVFTRNPSTGALTWLETKTNIQGTNQLDAPNDLAVSPDGSYVYATSGVVNTLVTFTRGVNGALTFLETKKDGVGGVTTLGGADGVAATNSTVYVAGSDDSSLTAFSRGGGGTLTLLDSETDGAGGVDGLNDANDAIVAPDGENVYTSAGGSDNAITTFDVAGNGSLTFNETDEDTAGTSFAGPIGIDASADNNNVYVASNAVNSVATFSRAANGKLTLLETDTDGASGVDGLAGAWDVVSGKEGASVYVIGQGESEVATFSRNAGTGALTFVEVDSTGATPQGVAASSDSKSVYAGAQIGDTLSVFSRELLAPSNATLPVVSGAAEVGSTLTCSNGTWNGVPTPGGFTREWLRNGVPIPAQTGTTYVTGQADVGAAVACRVTAVNAAGSGNATSNAINVVDTVAPPLTALPPSGKPKLSTKGIDFTVGCGGEACTIEIQASLLVPKAKKKKGAGKSAGLPTKVVNIPPATATIQAGAPSLKVNLVFTPKLVSKVQSAVYPPKPSFTPKSGTAGASAALPLKTLTLNTVITAIDSLGNKTAVPGNANLIVPRPPKPNPKGFKP